jgi:hypothetical protein
MNTPRAGHGTAMVRARVLAVVKTADVCMKPSRNPNKNSLTIKSAS